MLSFTLWCRYCQTKMYSKDGINFYFISVNKKRADISTGTQYLTRRPPLKLSKLALQHREVGWLPRTQEIAGVPEHPEKHGPPFVRGHGASTIVPRVCKTEPSTLTSHIRITPCSLGHINAVTICFVRALH